MESVLLLGQAFVNFFECLIFICHGQLDFDGRETVFRCPVLLLHGCQPIDLNACFSLICISYVELCQRKQINLLTNLLNGLVPLHDPKDMATFH